MRKFVPARGRARLLCLSLGLVLGSTVQAASIPSPDHHEFEAMLSAPYEGQAAGDAREFSLHFAFPDALDPNTVAWRLEILDGKDQVLRAWHGEERMFGQPIEVNVPWNGRTAKNLALGTGHYRARLTAVAGDPVVMRSKRGSLRQRVDDVLAQSPAIDVRVQEWDIEIGQPARPVMPTFQPLPVASDPMLKSAPATGGLAYTVYFGNLHSQTNHSDGGGDLSTCNSSQAAQTGAFGPNDAFVYAKGKGLDFLMTSEHNHYFDGSSGTNSSASPTTAINLYQSGLTTATNFNSANPGFLAIYGMEWGVINNGGHLNIFNSNELLAWESNGSGQLLGNTFTAKSDYAALYTLMNSRGWIGMFNHPDSTGQFAVGGTDLGFSAAGDTVMVAAEIMNTSAFSNNTTESETGRSSYSGAFNKLLERGFHVAPVTDQDNHCANWGASYTNRTGVLIPTGSTLNSTNFLNALRARRMFATEDKTSQIVFTGNGHLMGETFSNSGALTLTANFASSGGATVSQVQIYEGVPGRNGTVTLLASTASTTITPSNGAHFYYAKITQVGGKVLWSAPLWVNQTTSSDSTAPTVSASESGTAGTITLSATASDNVGVSRVEFLVDGALKGTDTSSPYSITLDSTTLANGSHALVAKAYDAANNVGTSSTVNFSISNATAAELIVNGGYESGASSWTATSGVITNSSTYAAHGGTYKAWLNGYGSAHTDSVYQTITIPSSAANPTLSFWLRVDSDETTTTTAYDTLKVQVRNGSNTVLTTLATYSNLNESTSYAKKSFSLSAYKGQTVRIYFEGVEGSITATSFLIDDVSVLTQ